MAKKTFIKIRRGILEPKHINALGAAWYLFFYILDQADWETGKIFDWKDKFAADELGKPLSMIRYHRQLLQNEEYITCEKGQYSQIISVNRWEDPRNEIFDTPQTTNNSVLSSPRVESELSQSSPRVESELSQSRVAYPINGAPSYNKNKDIKNKEDKSKESSPPKFISEFITAVRVQFTNDKQPQMIDDLLDDYGEKIVLEAATWYGQNNPRNMGHAIKSIETALRNGWNSKKVDQRSENRKQIMAILEQEA